MKIKYAVISKTGRRSTNEDYVFEIKSRDRILLCSDGLYKSMPPEILKARMMDDKTPEEILDVFDFLCEKNGDDNYTAILAIVE